jgi:hypothetical protein
VVIKSDTQILLNGAEYKLRTVRTTGTVTSTLIMVKRKVSSFKAAV